MIITVITPTTGKGSLEKLIYSIDTQEKIQEVFHILLWDDFRSKESRIPESYNSEKRLSLVLPNGSGKNGNAPGSMLRSIGLMVANTDWVTFADDDVWWEKDHIVSLLKCLEKETLWARTYRNIWSAKGVKLGVDRFESVGDDTSRKVPYEMCDNNCMIFKREFGVYAAHLYRETKDYNDDRLMYNFLKGNAGHCAKTSKPTINHICPDKLENFFEHNCSQV